MRLFLNQSDKTSIRYSGSILILPSTPVPFLKPPLFPAVSLVPVHPVTPQVLPGSPCPKLTLESPPGHQPTFSLTSSLGPVPRSPSGSQHRHDRARLPGRASGRGDRVLPADCLSRPGAPSGLPFPWRDWLEEVPAKGLC